MDSTGQAFRATATVSGIEVADTRAGAVAWTASVQAGDLSGPGVISAQDVGLPSLVLDPVPGNALPGPPGNLTTADNPPADPRCPPGAPGHRGLGAFPHTLAQADQGIGTIGLSGVISVTAPSSTPAGRFTGVLTFTIS